MLTAYSFVDLIDEAVPEGPQVLEGNQSLVFAVLTPEPEPNSLRFVWAIDDVVIEETDTGEIELTGNDFGEGAHVLSVDIVDETDLVRKDSTTLSAAYEWSVTASNVSSGNFLGFEENPLGWTKSGPATISASTDANDGAGSLRVQGCGYTNITSRTFARSEIGTITNKLKMDVKLSPQQQNPYWLGQIQAFLTIPGTTTQNQQIAAWNLTGLQLGQWETLTATLTSQIVTRLGGNYTAATLKLAVNTQNCATPMFLDAIRFDGSVTDDDEPISDFVCSGACASATAIARDQQSGSFNTTGERWYVVNVNINGWQASEMQGRTVYVNGVLVTIGQTALPPKAGGKYYFRFTGGSFPWTSWSFW